MREERIVMGMPARVELIGAQERGPIDAIYDLWNAIDERFSTYKDASEIMRINRGEVPEADYSSEMREVFSLAERTTAETNGYFNIKRPDGSIDPSGLVKGWALQKGSELAEELGFSSYYLEIAGDIQTKGQGEAGQQWSIGIRNPFNRSEIVKVLYPKGAGVATSGSAIRGQHIYNPHDPAAPLTDIASVTVVGPNIYEADRYATAAFAMGTDGISFLDALDGFEAYAIDRRGVATLTAGIDRYLTP